VTCSKPAVRRWRCGQTDGHRAVTQTLITINWAASLTQVQQLVREKYLHIVAITSNQFIVSLIKSKLKRADIHHHTTYSLLELLDFALKQIQIRSSG